MTPPSIDTSTREERLAYVREKWECMHNCELCGKCHILKGRDAETLYDFGAKSLEKKTDG